jgi:lipoate-protein ligase B
LGQIPYPNALALQRDLVQRKIENRLADDPWLILEHPPVYTLGRRGGRQNLNVSEGFLKSKQIPIIPVERGGDITYHGPGQIVGYPIIDLRRSRLGVHDYVEKMEAVMLRTAAHWNIPARRDARNRGVWVGDAKMGSIGIHIRRNIAFHGFAFNACPSLTPFEWINPCGLKGVAVTSLSHEIRGDIDLKTVLEILRRRAEETFGREFNTATLEDLGINPGRYGSGKLQTRARETRPSSPHEGSK